MGLHNKSLALIGAAGLFALFSSPAQSLSIDLLEISGGDSLGSFGRTSPAPALGGTGSLPSVMEAAARYWEDVIGDAGSLFVSFGWRPIEDGSLATAAARPARLAAGLSPGEIRDFQAGMVGAVQFNSAADRMWFADGDPADPSEFHVRRVDRTDLGGGDMSTGRSLDGATGAAAGSYDLYTAALHELGHTLGFFNFGDAAFLDGALPIGGGPFASAVLPLTGHGDPHIGDALGLALLGSGFAPGQRRLASDADVAAIAALSRFRNIDFAAAAAGFGRTVEMPLPASGVLLLAGLALLAATRSRRRPS